jgi:hypothetical protein
MEALANIATSTTLRPIGDVTNEDDQMIRILRSVQFCNAHVMIGLATKGVSIVIICDVVDCHFCYRC